MDAKGNLIVPHRDVHNKQMVPGLVERHEPSIDVQQNRRITFLSMSHNTDRICLPLVDLSPCSLPCPSLFIPLSIMLVQSDVCLLRLGLPPSLRHQVAGASASVGTRTERPLARHT